MLFFKVLIAVGIIDLLLVATILLECLVSGLLAVQKPHRNNCQPVSSRLEKKRLQLEANIILHF